MTSTYFCQTRGTGPDLVLIHGWGLNSGVWEPISERLQQHFRVTHVDLPGFGRNADHFPQPYTLSAIANLVNDCIPDGALVLGWSLGGLVAQQIALSNNRLAGLILVASTPHFVEQSQWPGIKPFVLSAFEKQLQGEFSRTLDRFLAVQAMGSVSAKDDIKIIRRHIKQYPVPSELALHGGLEILKQADLREQVTTLSLPVLQIFGRLDSLVPVKTREHMVWGEHVTQQVIQHASHGPFISHPQAFMQVLLDWTESQF